jgi:Domain of unknown function (DUF4173)
LLLMIPMFYFAVMLAIRTNELLTFLNVMAIIGLFTLLVFFYAADDLTRLSVWGYPLVYCLVFIKAFIYTFPVARDGLVKINKLKGSTRWIKPVARGVFIALPIFLVFLVLLTQADKFFADSVGNLFNFDSGFRFDELFGRLFLIIAVTWAITGSFAYALVRHSGRGNGAALPENLPGTLVPNPLIGFTELMIILGSINLLFAGFAWIQFEYLFSGKASDSMNYEQYRAYIHRGFGELLFTAALVLLFILGLRWLARHEKGWQMLVFNILATVTIGLAVVMIASAFFRMVVWEGVDYYIVTQLRDYVRSFILWLGLSFVWLLLTLWVRKVRFAIGFFVAILGFLVTVNVISSDGNIALANIEKYQNNFGSYDLAYRYLYTYSDDAVPALVSVFDKTQGDLRRNICYDLSGRYERLTNDKSWQNWTSFNYSRWQAYEQVDKLVKEGKLPSQPYNSGKPSCSTGA